MSKTSGTKTSGIKTSGIETSGIMLAERGALIRSIPRIFDELSEQDRDRLLAIGKRLSFAEGTPIFSQGDEHHGIHLIETGRVHSYYKAPSGRAVTLAYWLPGNFVGAPAMFPPAPMSIASPFDRGTVRIWTVSKFA